MALLPDDGQSLSALSLFVIQSLHGGRGWHHSRLRPVIVGLPLIVSWMWVLLQRAQRNEDFQTTVHLPDYFFRCILGEDTHSDSAIILSDLQRQRKLV